MFSDLFLSFGFTVRYHRMLSIWFYFLERIIVWGRAVCQDAHRGSLGRAVRVWAHQLCAGPGPPPSRAGRTSLAFTSSPCPHGTVLGLGPQLH